MARKWGGFLPLNETVQDQWNEMGSETRLGGAKHTVPLTDEYPIDDVEDDFGLMEVTVRLVGSEP